MDDIIQGQGELIIGSRQGSLEKSEVLEYRGEFIAGCRYGYGEGVFASGIRYIGEWGDDSPHGWGTMVYPNGDISEGNFTNGMLSDSGLMVFRSQDVVQLVNSISEDKANSQRQIFEENIAAAFVKKDPSLLLTSCSLSIVPQPLLETLPYHMPALNHRLDSLFDYASNKTGIESSSQNEIQPLWDLPSSQLPLRDDLYRGLWKLNYPHGTGAMDYCSGNIFLGIFSKGRREGEGILLRKRYKSPVELFAESMEDDLEGLPLNRAVSSLRNVELALLLSNGAFDTREKPMEEQNLSYRQHIEKILCWGLNFGRGHVQIISNSDCGQVLDYTLDGASYDVIRGVWENDRLKDVII